MLSRWREKRRLLREPFPDDWRLYIDAAVSQWKVMSAEEREHLEDDVISLLVDKRWEAARGFELTDEIRVTIAAQAALLILGIDDEDDPYHNVGTVIVHPTTLRMQYEQAGPAPGTVVDSPMAMLGLAEYDGPVIIAWDSVRSAARHGHGHNLVYHEFAHKLDFADGVIDGTPPIDTDEAMQRWIDVCTIEFDALQSARHEDPLLDGYAATNVAEFFAVVTEVFFESPAELEEAKPDLYGVMRDFYNQDPAARIRGRRPW